MLTCAAMFGGTSMPVNPKTDLKSTIAKSLLALSLIEKVAQSLLPSTCCLCGGRGETLHLDLCAGCRTLLPLNASNGDAFPACAPTVVRVVVPFHYAYPVNLLIRALKFHGERAHARVLGLLLADSVRSLRCALPELIVPMPLHARRYRERGFNQAHEIARYTGASLCIPVDTRHLVRRRETLEQSGLSLAERRGNVRGAFEVARPFTAMRVALIDDVVTTGSTALAAAQALLAGGVSEVEVWAVARVLLNQPRHS
jgi:ComF family protein